MGQLKRSLKELKLLAKSQKCKEKLRKKKK